MVFPELRFKSTNWTFLFPLCLGVFAVASVGCTSRGAKSVSVQCAPGQTQGPDGKCQASAAPTSPTPGDPNQPSGEEQFVPEEEFPQEQEETSLLPEGSQDDPSNQPQTNDTPGTQSPPFIPDPQSPTPPSSPSPPSNPGPQNPNPNPNPNPGNNTLPDTINQSETVSTLFKDAPKTKTEGVPLLALKLTTSSNYGKIARVAFSYTTGVTNTEYKYHKKTIRTIDTPFNSDGSLKVEITGIPVSVSFDWDGKRCETEVIEVGFETKTTTATCK